MYQINDLAYSYWKAASGNKGGTLVKAGKAGDPVDTKGCNNYRLIVETLNGTDVLGVEGQILESGWYNARADVTANGNYEFTGIWDKLRIVKRSGTGTTTVAYLRAVA